ncbi:GntR family transcriptional regulator [Bounagaea algeriensis]
MKATRTEQITESYRHQIREGEINPGDRLPSSRDLAAQHGISEPTARSVLSALRVGGYTVTTQRGSFVAPRPPGVDSPQDRLRRAVRAGTTSAETEMQHVLAAELVAAPTYITEIYDLEPGDQVVRREYTIASGDHVLALHVDWYRAEFAAAVPALLSLADRTGGDLLNRIEEAFDRRVTHGRDAVRSRATDEREASALQVSPGSPTLAGAHAWSDENGLIVYGEWCLPAGMEVGFSYDLD